MVYDAVSLFEAPLARAEFDSVDICVNPE
jgi:hypothetical protein